LYLIGDEAEYKIGGGLIHELRDPIIKAMAAQKELEELDIQEEEEDERKAVQAEQLRAQGKLEKMAKEEEEREQEELRKSQEELDKLVREQPPVEDELEKPTEHTGKDSKPLRT
jgi:cytochrome c556